jgi:CheY-specific phosphatase CheX
MQPIEIQKIFLESASEVLETMFFTGIEDENASDADITKVSAELGFNGHPSGKFGVQVPLETGRLIAANFLGSEEITDAQVAEVVGELSNMLCGSVLSRLEAGARFELFHPEIDLGNLSWHERPEAVGCTFGLGEGTITMWIVLNESNVACPAA